MSPVLDFACHDYHGSLVEDAKEISKGPFSLFVFDNVACVRYLVYSRWWYYNHHMYDNMVITILQNWLYWQTQISYQVSSILETSTFWKYRIYWVKNITYIESVVLYDYTRRALWASTSSWRPFRPLDFVLRTLRALRLVRRAHLRSGPVKMGHVFLKLCIRKIYHFVIVFFISFSAVQKKRSHAKSD